MVHSSAQAASRRAIYLFRTLPSNLRANQGKYPALFAAWLSTTRCDIEASERKADILRVHPYVQRSFLGGVPQGDIAEGGVPGHSNRRGRVLLRPRMNLEGEERFLAQRDALSRAQRALVQQRSKFM